MNELEVLEKIKIEDMIYEIRGKQVMLDSDLARIYHCKNGTKEINQDVKNNINKFPERYSWVLTDEESNKLLVKFFDQKIERRGGRYKNPRVFTEEGVAMLATILKTKVASRTSIAIMDAFVNMRKFISTNMLEQRFINNMVLEHDNDIKILKETFSKFDNLSNEIFYEGQIYDAYSLLLDILNSSKERIIVIDNFANKKLFDLLSKTNKRVTVYSKNIDEELINKYQKQYHNVELKYNNSFHDRFIIIDNIILYNCGASFKDLGTKCFAINKIDNSEMIIDMLSKQK